MLCCHGLGLVLSLRKHGRTITGQSSAPLGKVGLLPKSFTPPTFSTFNNRGSPGRLIAQSTLINKAFPSL